MKNFQITINIPESTINSIRERFENWTQGMDYEKDTNLLFSISRDEFDKLMEDDKSKIFKDILEQLVDKVKGLYYSDRFMEFIKENKLSLVPKNGRGKHVHRGRHAKKGDKHA